MPVRRVIPSGFCQGVVIAIHKVIKAVQDYPGQSVFVIGMIVHNRYVVEAFRRLGVVTLEGDKEDAIDSIKSGIVVFTAHGISDHIRNKAISKGLTVIDATCPHVRRNMETIREFINQGYEVFYIGKRNHPEAEAALSISDHVHLITCEDDINGFEGARIAVTTQTTMSLIDTAQLEESISRRYPQAFIQPHICDATQQRQQAIMDLENCDVLIVVGDTRSNNTAQLANIAIAGGIGEVYRVESAQELEQLNIDTTKNISVTAGASTPRYLIDNVISYLRTSDVSYTEVDIERILSSFLHTDADLAGGIKLPQ